MSQKLVVKPKMDPRALEATLANAKVFDAGLGFHDPAFAHLKRPESNEKKP